MFKRLGVAGGWGTYDAKEHAAWLEAFPNNVMREWYQSEHTFWGGTHSSRLDRIYSNMGVGAAASRHTSTWVGDREIGVSDHKPVFLRMRRRAPEGQMKRSPVISESVAKHPLFEKKVYQHWEEMGAESSSNAWDKLSMLKDAFRRAAAEISVLSSSRVVITMEERLSVTTNFLRAAEDLDSAAMEKLAARFEPLKKWCVDWSGAGGGHALLAFLGSLHLHDVHAELEELKQARELPEYAKSKRKNLILLRLKRMSPAPDTALRAVVDPDTRSLTSSDADFSRVMSSHWGKVFGRTVTDESLGQKYLSNISDLPEMRTCSLDTVRERLAMYRKSSLGPDGIPFQCFRSVLDLGRAVLYEVLNTLRDPNGTTPPPNFNEAFLYLLPKKPLSEVDDMPAYGAADTRPLSVCNTDNRLLSGFLRWELEESLNKWICVAQRGFLPNWWILDNVLDVDCVAQRACLKGSWGASLLFDFMPASRRWRMIVSSRCFAVLVFHRVTWQPSKGCIRMSRILWFTTGACILPSLYWGA